MVDRARIPTRICGSFPPVFLGYTTGPIETRTVARESLVGDPSRGSADSKCSTPVNCLNRKGKHRVPRLLLAGARDSRQSFRLAIVADFHQKGEDESDGTRQRRDCGCNSAVGEA